MTCLPSGVKNALRMGAVWPPGSSVSVSFSSLSARTGSSSGWSETSCADGTGAVNATISTSRMNNERCMAFLPILRGRPEPLFLSLRELGDDEGRMRERHLQVRRLLVLAGPGHLLVDERLQVVHVQLARLVVEK